MSVPVYGFRGYDSGEPIPRMEKAEHDSHLAYVKHIGQELDVLRVDPNEPLADLREIGAPYAQEVEEGHEVWIGAPENFRRRFHNIGIWAMNVGVTPKPSEVTSSELVDPYADAEALTELFALGQRTGNMADSVRHLVLNELQKMGFLQVSFHASNGLQDMPDPNLIVERYLETTKPDTTTNIAERVVEIANEPDLDRQQELMDELFRDVKQEEQPRLLVGPDNRCPANRSSFGIFKYSEEADTRLQEQRVGSSEGIGYWLDLRPARVTPEHRLELVNEMLDAQYVPIMGGLVSFRNSISQPDRTVRELLLERPDKFRAKKQIDRIEDERSDDTVGPLVLHSQKNGAQVEIMGGESFTFWRRADSSDTELYNKLRRLRRAQKNGQIVHSQAAR